MRIFAYNQSSKQSLNSKTEAHSLSLSVDSRGAGQYSLGKSVIVLCVTFHYQYGSARYFYCGFHIKELC